MLQSFSTKSETDKHICYKIFPSHTVINPFQQRKIQIKDIKIRKSNRLYADIDFYVILFSSKIHSSRFITYTI
jgi:hypothetical protein